MTVFVLVHGGYTYGYSQRPNDRAKSHGPGITDSFTVPLWVRNSCSLKKLLTIDSSLQFLNQLKFQGFLNLYSQELLVYYFLAMLLSTLWSHRNMAIREWVSQHSFCFYLLEHTIENSCNFILKRLVQLLRALSWDGAFHFRMYYLLILCLL